MPSCLGTWFHKWNANVWEVPTDHPDFIFYIERGTATSPITINMFKPVCSKRFLLVVFGDFLLRNPDIFVSGLFPPRGSTKHDSLLMGISETLHNWYFKHVTSWFDFCIWLVTAPSGNRR